MASDVCKNNQRVPSFSILFPAELLSNKIKVFIVLLEKVEHFSVTLQNPHLQDIVHVDLRQPANRTTLLYRLLDHHLTSICWLELHRFPIFVSHFLLLREERSCVLGAFLFFQFATYFLKESFFCCLVEGHNWLVARKVARFLSFLWAWAFGVLVCLIEGIDLYYFRVVYGELIGLKVNRNDIFFGLLDYYLIGLLFMLSLIFNHLHPFSFDQLPL